jgi:hypothetical protein
LVQIQAYRSRKEEGREKDGGIKDVASRWRKKESMERRRARRK